MTTLTTTDLDERTALSDRAVALLRTAVPGLWAALVTTLLRITSPHLPGDVGTALADLLRSELAVTVVVVLVLALWYWLWRRVEPLVPDWLVRLVLGSARTPVYALPAAAVVETSDGRLVTGVLPASTITAAKIPASTLTAHTVDLTAARPEGYDTDETSTAKAEVADLLGQDFGGHDDDPAFDPIDAAEAAVERLIAIGWRPASTSDALTAAEAALVADYRALEDRPNPADVPDSDDDVDEVVTD